jgi:7-cyano-7-deazaguanine synthase
MEKLATEGFAHPDLQLYVPFIHETKASIVTVGARVGVPFEQTWSCYSGGELHCGRCSTCLERMEAFYLAGVSDPTKYADESLFTEMLAEGRLG